jgi:type 1 glutamine amidotransferase
VNFRKIIGWSLGLSVLLLVVAFVTLLKFFGLILVPLDDAPPLLPEELDEPAVLVFSKANGFVHEAAIPAAEELVRTLAARNGWSVFVTDNGAIMNPEQLARFAVVVGNNNSGTFLSPDQQQALRRYILTGGGYVGLHGAGGDFYYSWDWYVQELIGAQFTGHTMDPQFQDAVVERVEPSPLTAHLPQRWSISNEEWYAFADNPRRQGITILLALDEASYRPGGASMTGEHPVAWNHDLGEGRVVYSAIGHQAETYALPAYRQFLERAIAWAGGLP